MVCRMYDLDHWKLGKGSHPYVFLLFTILVWSRD